MVTPTVIVPLDAIVQVYPETIPVPFVEGSSVGLLKPQLGVVLKVYVWLPELVGVPDVAVSKTSWFPVLVKVPDPVKVTPLAVADML
jgi:hypothetical protein